MRSTDAASISCIAMTSAPASGGLESAVMASVTFSAKDKLNVTTVMEAGASEETVSGFRWSPLYRGPASSV